MGRNLKLLLDWLLKAFSLFVIILLLISSIFFVFFVLDTESKIPKSNNPQIVQLVTHEWKLNEPIYVQYVDYVVKCLSGNLHTSLGVQKGVHINHFIGLPIELTLFLVATIGFLSFLLGTLYERFASRHSNGTTGKLMHLIALLFWATPIFAFVMLIITVYANTSSTLPISGNGLGGTMVGAPILDKIGSFLLHAFIPVLTGVLINFGFLVFIIRGGRSLTPEQQPIYKRWRDILTSLRKVPWFVMFFFAWLMTSVLLIDIVYNYRGLGLLLWEAVSARDIPTVMATFYAIGIIVVIADFSYGIVFPSSRKSEELASPQEVGSYGPSGEAQKTEPITVFAKRVWTNYLRSRSGILALIVFAILVLVSIAAPVLSTVRDPEQTDHLEPSYLGSNWLNPLTPSLTPSPYTGKTHPLGTDFHGADVYSMILYGGSGAVLSAVMWGIVSLVFGTIFGLIGAISLLPASRTTRVLGWIFREIGLTYVSVPLFVILACIAVIELPSPWFFSFGLPMLVVLLIYSWAWMFVAYDVRDEGMRIMAERGGTRPSPGELLPRILKRTLFVTKFLTMIGLLVIFSLGFFGVSPVGSHSSWGQMLESAYERDAPIAGQWWLIIPVTAAIMLLVMSTFVIIDRLEAAVDWHETQGKSPAAEPEITAA